MPASKGSALAELTTVADGDYFIPIDVSDTTMAPTGTNKKSTARNVAKYMAAVIAEKYGVWRSGAVGDGVTDDTSALQAAANVVAAVGGTMLLDRAHLVTGTVTLTGSVVVDGHAGNASAPSVVESSATSGPVIQITGRSCGVRNVKIDATTARRAASTTTGHGILITGGDVASPASLSRQVLEDVLIVDQPTDGVHTIGTLELSKFDTVTVQDCIRHGFVHDGGTVAGYSNVTFPPFYVSWKDCRALECGGQALIVQSSGGNAPSRIHLDHFEALSCAWDSTKRYTGVGGGSELYQCIIGGRGIVILQADIEDQLYAASTTVGGKSRTSLANPAKGIYCNGFGTVAIQPLFSSLVQSWQQQTATSGLLLLWPDVNLGAYATPQAPAIDIAASSCLDIEAHLLTALMAGATTKIVNRSVNARIVIDGIPKIGDAFSAADSDYADGLAPVAVELATDILTTTSRRTQVEGQSGAADNLATIRLASGINGTAGMDMLLFRGGEDITVKHGTGNIKTATAADVVMTATANTVLHFAYDGTNWVQV